MKLKRKSKTLWINTITVILALVAIIVPDGREWLAENPEVNILLLAITNIALRFFTKDAIACLFALLLVSCTTQYQILDTSVYYKRDLMVTSGGVKYEGVTVAPKKDAYEFLFESPGDLTYLIVRTCHREDTFKPEQKHFLFIPTGDKKVRYKFIPTELEKAELCPLRADVYDSKTEQHSWLFLDFLTDSLKLKGELTCSGVIKPINGVQVCQVRQGLVQVIKMHEQIRFAPPMPETCPLPVDRGNNTFEIKVANEECVYYMESKSRDRARVTFIGYSGLLVRGGV